jgi:signal transduction histidine kinase
VRAQVAASLKRGEDGVARIEPNRLLRQLVAQNPHLKYAVFDLRLENALPGSSADFVERISRLGGIQPYTMNFRLSEEPAPNLRGALIREDTSVGRVIIVTYGYILHWDDLVYFVRDNARDNFIYFIPVAIAALLIAWFAVKRGLAPLRIAAAYAQRIDMNSIEQRIPLDGIPKETLPLVEAINAALARLDAGAMRQRRFAANAAHEMRTPVAILRTRVDALDDAPYKTDLKRDVRRLQNIVEQLLIAARLGEQSAPIDEHVDVVLTIRSMVADYAPLVIENHRNIEFDSDFPRLVVVGNRRAIECAVANLIDNALRAEPLDGCVIVRVEPGVRISVIDHGEGVPPAMRDVIFEPFWRGSEASPGTGLGLAIVKELVELHKGSIAVENTPGGGSTFVMTFPQLAN